MTVVDSHERGLDARADEEGRDIALSGGAPGGLMIVSNENAEVLACRTPGYESSGLNGYSRPRCGDGMLQGRKLSD